MWTASDTWKGAGCSKGWGFDYRFKQVRNLTPEVVTKSISDLKELDNDGLIDPLSNLSSGNRAAYIISGKNDKVVPKENQKAAYDIMLAVGLPEEYIGINEYKNGHKFDDDYPQEILSFLWSSLGYGEIKEPGNWKDNP